MEKLSLVDYDGELACVLFTAGCNLRCPYCHNADLVIGKNIFEIKKHEIFEFLEKRKKLLTAIVVSGGEPTLNPDLPEFLKELKQFGLKIKLDTNGTNPVLLEKIIDEKLVDFVAMDIKSSKQGYIDKFGATPALMERISQSVEILKQNKVNYEFRCTLSNETCNDKIIEDMGAWIAGAPRLYLQAFEDVGTNLEQNLTGVNKEKAQNYAEIFKKYVKNVNLRGY